MKTPAFSVCGTLAAALLAVSTLLAQKLPLPVSSPPPPQKPASASTVTAPRQTATAIAAGSLHFVSAPVNAVDLVLAQVAKMGERYAPADVTLLSIKQPPLPLYHLDPREIANGQGLENLSSNIMAFVVESAGQPVAGASLQVDAAVATRVNNRYVDRRLDEVVIALQEVKHLAALEQVKAGSYEVRLITEIEQSGVSAIWLKSTIAGGDLVYPFSTDNIHAGKRANPAVPPIALSDPNPSFFRGITLKKLYTAAEFIDAFRPYFQTLVEPAFVPMRWFSEKEMSNYFVNRFVASNGFGVNRVYDSRMELNDSMLMSINNSMRMVVADPSSGKDTKSTATKTYQLDGFELIGIAKHEAPVAFVTIKHKTNPAPPATRTLTDFETNALATLRNGTEVATQAEKDHLMVIGAIRAQESCLRCHPGYKSGDVLGALSFRLSLVDPTAMQAISTAPTGK